MCERSGPPPASSEAASHRMKSVRQRDTAAELAIRSEVFRLGGRYRVDYQPLGGLRRRADLAFPGARLAVFIDGCFWHGCPLHATEPKSNAAFWRGKILGNRERDRETNVRLREAGWTVLRIWEHETPKVAARHVWSTYRRLRNGSHDRGTKRIGG